MVKITNITPAQAARMPVFREEMRAKGLRLQWASEDEIRDSVTGLYEAVGRKKPAVFVSDSPLACLAARMIIKALLKNDDQFEDQIRSQLRDQIKGHLGSLSRDQFGSQLVDQFGQLRSHLGGRFRDQIGDRIRSHLGDQLRDQLVGQIWDQLRRQLVDQLERQLVGQEIEHQSLWFAGGSEVYWVAWYQYAAEIGVTFTTEQTRWLDAWLKYSETAGCLYPYEGMAFVSRRPTRLSFDNDKILHSKTGPVMAFADGFSFYAWHGVRVPGHWIEAPDAVKPEEILASENVEQRAAGLAIVGMSKMLDSLDHKIIDSDPDPMRGEIYEVRIPGLPDPGRYLKVECPRNGMIFEGVPNDINTVLEAQAWRVGIPASEFTFPERRT